MCEDAETNDLTARATAYLLALSAMVAISIAMPSVAAGQGDEGSDSSKGSGSSKSAGTGIPSGSFLGAGIGGYVENSRRDGEEQRGRETTDESHDYNADNLLTGSVWYLTTAAPRVRVGGGLQYFGGYEAMREPGEDEEEEEIEAYEYGQMLTPYARAEWLVPFLDQFQMALGAQAGLTLLFPDGDFRREIEEMKDQDISVFGGPRWGVDVAPSVGVRWQLDRRLALRSDFSVHWQRVYALSVDDTVEGVDYARSWTLKVLRYDIGIAMEITL